MINLGDKVRDKVSGFEGIVLARMECLYEATECRVYDPMSHGSIRESVWFEADRLEVIKEHAVVGFVDVAGKTEEVKA